MFPAPHQHSVLLRDGPGGDWLHFTKPQEVLIARRLEEVLPVLTRLQERVDGEGLHAAGFIAYEAAPAFDAALEVRPAAGFPLLWFGLYPLPERLAHLPPAEPLPRLVWTPSQAVKPYYTAIARIKDYIARGDTYQVNYTIRLRAEFDGEPWALFRQLAAAQQAGYAAYVDAGPWVLCSSSPELFFRLEGRRLTARPMKGTAPRGRTPAEDQAQAAWLQTSEKNRAENVMIVDMLRNDLGRVADFGSVQVPCLFEVERYPTVWQMTSTVTAESDAGLSEILAALFPCASITGAPKRRTMQIIAALESDPRLAYCGAIGYLAPQRRAQFNVAIRTVIVNRTRGTAEYGVGGGIVWDSTSAGEYEECLIKARVLSRSEPDFELLESLLWTPEAGCFLLKAHLERMSASGHYFGYPFDPQAARQALQAHAAALPPQPHKLRLLLGRLGALQVRSEALETPAPDQRLRLRLARQPVDSSDLFLYHKTTHRQVYEDARRVCPQCDDVLLWNERGELTETTTGNLVVELGGRLLTPPLASGLLPGVFRQSLLDSGQVQEHVLRKEDLLECREIFVVNSVRRWRPADLLP